MTPELLSGSSHDHQITVMKLHTQLVGVIIDTAKIEAASRPQAQ
jgi:hypothetical protein